LCYGAGGEGKEMQWQRQGFEVVLCRRGGKEMRRLGFLAQRLEVDELSL
jgi:hypothetical protein